MQRGDGQTRDIGRWGALSTVAGSMLGIGIFLVPPVVSEILPTNIGFFSVWIFAGIAALSGAVSYAELGGMFPRAGGDYVFQDEAYGKTFAFASGWVLFAGIFTGSIAAVAVPLCEHQIATLAEAVGLGFAPKRPVGVLGLTQADVVGMAIVGAVTAINTLRVRISSAVQTLVTLLPIAALAVGGVLILLFGDVAGAKAATGTAPASVGPYFSAWVEAYTAVYFAYSGWNAVIYVAGEVEKPGEVIPFGLVGGTVTVTLVYLILCAAFVTALGFGGLAEAVEAGTAAARSVAGPSAGMFVTTIIAVGMLASVNATVLGGARVC